MITQLGQINSNTPEGALCIALLAVVTTELWTDKTPSECIQLANERIPQGGRDDKSNKLSAD